jgi:hypothetical protein
MVQGSNAGRDKTLSLLQNHPGWVSDPPSLQFMYQDPCLRLGQLGHKADLSPPSGAEVKNEWSYTPTPPICLHSMVKNNYALFYLANHVT